MVKNCFSKTSPNALQPTQERTTLTPQALDPPSQRLAAQAIPAEATIEYLSKLSPTTPTDLPQLALYLHDHPDRASVDAVLTDLSQGFKIGFQGPRVLISAKQSPHIISTNLLKELRLSHTAGPFVSPPFPNFQVYPIGVIPKKHSTEWRTTFHLSFPKNQTTSVNSHIRPTDYSLHYITIDTAISIIQNIGKLGASCPSWTSSQHPSDWELLVMKWNSLYFFDTVPPYLFDQFSCMVEWIIKNKLGIPNEIHILDDFFFFTSPPRSDCLTALCKILCLFTELNIPVAPGKTFAPATSLEFMGILLNSTRMEARLPLDKLICAKEALQQWLCCW